MSLKQFLADLTEKVLPGLSRGRRREEQKTHRIKWYTEQIKRIEAGAEIEPPWIAFPNSEPSGWNQGYQEAWKVNVWLPFWRKLTDESREEYLERWQPPTENWREFLIVHWMNRQP